MNRVSGLYETTYGNTVEYTEGEDQGFDVDMQKEIPLDMIDFEKFIAEIE